MILYNVTVSVDKPYEMEWLTYIKEEYIPKVMATGRFVDSKVYKLVNAEDEGATYSLQYFAQNIMDLETYLAVEGPAIIQEHYDRYKDKHVAFRTVLEEVD
jgi:hypothetical protein